MLAPMKHGATKLSGQRRHVVGKVAIGCYATSAVVIDYGAAAISAPCF